MKRSITMGLVASAFFLVTMACGMITINFPAVVSGTATSLPATAPVIVALPTDTPMPPTETPPAPTDTAVPLDTPTSTPAQVVVTVIKDGVLIRRGPSTDYNVLGSFLPGQSAIATGRNYDSSWLVIPLPKKPSVFGWVPLKDQVTSVEGDIQSLDLTSYDPPIPARIRNCTIYAMLIKPGNVVLKAKADAPSNSSNFPPGTYTAYDQHTAGHPKVASFVVNEGDKVDIQKDGMGNPYTCP